MSWPADKRTKFHEVTHYMTKQEKKRHWNEIRTLKARGLCSRCKTEPRSSTMTICKACHRDFERVRIKKVRAERRLQKKKDFIENVLKHRCCLCREWVDEPFTRTGNIRFSCKRCWTELWHRRRMGEDIKPWVEMREAIRRCKIAAGIMPRDAWEYTGRVKKTELEVYRTR